MSGKRLSLFLTTALLIFPAFCALQAVSSSASSAVSGENLILSGSFENGAGGWDIYLEGGSAGFGIRDGVMNLDITGTGSVDYGVQLYYDGFSVYENGVYEIQFDVSSTVERTLDWRIQLNGGDYHAYAWDRISVGPDMQHISQTFTMEEPTDPAPRLCFNCGSSEGYAISDTVHTISFDNVTLRLLEGSGAASAEGTEDSLPQPEIRLNQLGYRPDMTKTAVVTVPGNSRSWSILSADGCGDAVFTGKLPSAVRNEASGETVQVIDFTEFSREGRYFIQLEDGTLSTVFTISDSVYDNLSGAALHFFELAECGTSVDDDTFGHEACHTSAARIYGTDTFIDVSGGWHDAGDYGRYTVPGAKAAADLLLAYEDFGDSRISGIVRYELEWMLKMQNAETGGVYHKVTCSGFPGFVMPEEETKELLIMPVSTTATGAFAAVMAMAADDYQETDSTFADRCLKAALKAQAYLDSVPADTTGFKNPPDISTGEYGDGNDSDERFWALAQLYRTTGDTDYLKKAEAYLNSGLEGGLGWAETSLYGIYAIAKSSEEQNSLSQRAAELLLAKADEFLANSDTDRYGSALGTDYVWGSSMVAANRGMTMLMASRLSGDAKYLPGAEKQLNYLLGTNTTGYCFVTGFGEKSPEHPHHRPSVAKGMAQPGMLVGGPDSALEDPTAQGYLSGSAPAACYIDSDQSYSTNEVTIYWNSPLVYLVQGM